MKVYSVLRLAISLLLLINLSTVDAQDTKVSLNSSKTSTWFVKPKSEITSIVDLFQREFNPKEWVKATVPGTVFASYVEQGLEKDPNFADNIYKVDKSKYDRDFWYRTEFNVPASYKLKHIWLNFEGVNRKAEVYLNGKRLGDLDGFMERGKFDITNVVSKDKANVLAVLTDCPILPITNYASPTYISSSSWDWMPYVPGLNSGITDDVYLSNSGDITISDPWVRTDALSLSSADLSVSIGLINNTNEERKGVVTGVINPGNVQFTRNVKLSPQQINTITFNKKAFSQLTLKNPKLWWPNGYGEANIYTCELKFTVGDEVSDNQKVDFGIKKYAYDTIGGVLHVSVNGTRIFLKGGNWGMSEYMLRCRGNEYDTKVRFHKEMNYNIIRNWIGSTTDDEFYQACDKYGIMVWDDFWLNSHPNLPTDVFAFNKNAVEKIKRLRNHPSIALWCGDNEGYPLPPLNGWLREDVSAFDGNDRWYQPNSHSDALTGSGIWANLEPQAYFASPPLGFGGNKGWGLRSEIGTAVFTTFESFKEFMPKENWWPQNEMWNKHFFGRSAGNAGPDSYVKAINTSYGQATGIEDFCRKSQLLNLETTKALYEGWLDHIWNDASGVIIWMSQSAYPSFVWQTYDYYYDLTGAYWGAKKACEPIHILWNCANNAVKVVNTSNNDLKAIKAEASVYNKDGKEVFVYHNSKIIDVLKNSGEPCFVLNFDKDNNLAFLKPAFASSFTKDADNASAVTDGGMGSRWSSEYNDNQWIYVDLGAETEFNNVELDWESAYGKAYKLQISSTAETWTDIYSTIDCKGGKDRITFPTVKARYVRMLGLKRASQWGYSLWEFKVYNLKENSSKKNLLSDIHFIKLRLTDAEGNLLSDNFYWRGNKSLDYTGLNSMPKADLKVSSKITKENGKCIMNVKITNSKSSPAVAFAVRLQVVKAKTGKRILPVFMNDNYFSLVRGETKNIQIEFNEDQFENDLPRLVVEQFNSKTQQSY